MVLPVRNEQRFVGTALRSLQQQTERDFEVVVVDDGSVDTTAGIVHSFAAEDPRIQLMANPGRGLVPALNAGVDAARAELVARMDADDRSRPRRLELQLREFARNPRVAALGTYGFRVNERGIPLGPLRTGPAGRTGYLEARARRRPIHLIHPSVVFRRDAFRQVGGYDPGYRRTEDYKLWNALADLGEVYALPRALTVVTIRTTSFSAADFVEQQQQVARIEQEVAGGPVFDDVTAFAAWAASAGAGAGADRSRWIAEGAQRHFARSLVNLEFRQAWDLWRSGAVSVAILPDLVRKGVRG